MNDLELQRAKSDALAWLSRYDRVSIPLTELCRLIETDLPIMLQDLILADLQNQCIVEGAKARIWCLRRDAVSNGLIVMSEIVGARESHTWRIQSEVDADDLRVGLLQMSESEIRNPYEISKDSIAGLGKIRSVKISIDRQLEYDFTHNFCQPVTRVLYRLVSLVACVVETVYSELTNLLKKRMYRLSIEIYSDMYMTVRQESRDDPQSASHIFLCAACATSGVIYAPDPYAIDASFRVSASYKGVGGHSPLDIASRFWDSFACTASTFPISRFPANANLLKSPYESTQWQTAERVIYESDELRGQTVAEVANIRIEAWYPSAMASKIDAVLPNARSSLQRLLCDYYEKVKNDLGDLGANLPCGAVGGFIAGSSSIIEALAESRQQDLIEKESDRKMKAQKEQALDSESRELIAVHHVGLIAFQAGQIYRGYTNSDHGIDGEIEFKDDQGRASGIRLYLQLKSGDSYLRKRQRDDREVFYIKKPGWADYWQKQAYPVMLVVRAASGEIRWMNIGSYLKNESTRGQTVKQVIFQGEQFDVASILRWRRRLLSADNL